MSQLKLQRINVEHICPDCGAKETNPKFIGAMENHEGECYGKIDQLTYALLKKHIKWLEERCRSLKGKVEEARRDCQNCFCGEECSCDIWLVRADHQATEKNKE